MKNRAFLVYLFLSWLGVCIGSNTTAVPQSSYAEPPIPKYRVDARKFEASQRDIKAICDSAGRELWRFFPDYQIEPFVVARGEKNPIVLYKRNEQGEIVLRLNTHSTYWCQYTYQFAHEFCHILCGCSQKNQRHKWFEETLCETASLFVLRAMAKAWEQDPPYPHWKEYRHSLQKYAENVIAKYETLSEENVKTFYRKHQEELKKNSCQRALNGPMAVVLLKCFEQKPEHWEILRWLNRAATEKEDNFQKFLQNWYDAVPARHQPFIGKIADLYAVKIRRQDTDLTLEKVNTSTLTGKVMCGYQGWFNCPGDGSERGWFHWGKGRRFEPGRCTIDLWPDMTDYSPDERYPTAFKHQDGSTAHVFSSLNRKTVLRHFRWMQEYGIDGVFVQRFAVQTFNRSGLNHCNTVLDHCRTGANQFGRAYAVMYDLSGLRNNQMQRVIEDWKRLVDKLKITKDPQDKAYLHHNGKPVVAVWGIGFKDGRRYTLDECATLIDFLKNDPRYGGCTVMIGIPTWWRTLNRDSVPDKKLHDVIRKADIISPWTVGRYRTLDGVSDHARDCWAPDIEWCKKNNLEYLPVVFPGFSWHNMKPNSKLDQIPRQKGRFLWQQYVEAQNAGATMIYQAMFDEVDEATAIFKCTNNPPTGASPFLTYEGLPSDYYLRLVGHATRYLHQKRSLPSDPTTSDK